MATKINVTDFGGFAPQALGYTVPATVTYDPSAGNVIDREHAQGKYEPAQMTKPSGRAPEERVPFELEPRR
jgi:hypothetical protein